MNGPSKKKQTSLLAAGTVLLALLLFSCGDSPRSTTPADAVTRADFEVVAFLQDGGREVRRDEPLVIDFSAPVDPSSVGSDTVHLHRRRGSEEIPLTLTVDGCRMTLRAPGPFGLEGNSGYGLNLEGFPSLDALRALDGRPLARRFLGRFRTSSFYGPEIARPVVEGIRAVEEPGGRWSLEVVFSEPVDPGTVRGPGGLSFLEDPGAVIPGKLSHDREARVFRFLPATASRPARVKVVPGRDISDLAGNTLVQPDPPEYTVALPGMPPTDVIGEIAEDFTTTEHLDPSETTANWNPPRAPGVLLGEPDTVKSPLPGWDEAPEAEIALGADRVVIRVLLTPRSLGPPREITALLLAPAGSVVPGEYEELSIRVTRTLAESLDDRGVDVGPGEEVFRQSPWRPQVGEREAIAIPLQSPVSYDRTSGLLVEIVVGPGTHTNLLRARPCDPAEADVSQGGTRRSLWPVLAVRGFSFEPVATSLFYDTGQPSPSYLPPVLRPAEMPPGVTLSLSWQGAAHLRPDGGPPEDPAVLSDWVDDVTRLSGFRYLRFRANFRGVSLDGREPVIDDLRIPFRGGR